MVNSPSSQSTITQKPKESTTNSATNSSKNTTQSETVGTPAPVVSDNLTLLGREVKTIQSNNYEEKSDVTMGGKVYTNAVVFYEKSYSGLSYANYNLNQQYASITGIFGHIDETSEYDATMNVYGDGKLIKSIDLKPNMFAETVTIDVQGVRLLKFEMPDIDGSGATYAFTGMALTASTNPPIPGRQTEVDKNAKVLGTDVETTESKNYGEEPTIFLGGIKQYNALVFYEKSYSGNSSSTYNLTENTHL